jgi:hypothetical protein
MEPAAGAGHIERERYRLPGEEQRQPVLVRHDLFLCDQP